MAAVLDGHQLEFKRRHAMKGIANRRGTLKISSVPSDDGKTEISVADVGTGVEVDDADEIAAKLFTTRPCGVGLGLSASRAIMETRGVWIAAAPNAPRELRLTFGLRVTEADL